MNDPGILSGLIAIVILGLFGTQVIFWSSRSVNRRAFELSLFASALAIRFVVSVALYGFDLVSIIKDEDGSVWTRAITRYDQWTAAGLDLFSIPQILIASLDASRAATDSYHGYVTLLGSFFLATGMPQRLVAAALNNFLGALTVVIIYRISSASFSPWVAVRVAWIACFQPSAIIWGAQTIKEPIILLLEACALYGFIRIQQRRFSLPLVLGVVASVLALAPFRFYAVYLVGSAFVVTIAVEAARRRGMNVVAGLVVGGLVLAVLGSSGILARDQVALEQFDLERIAVLRAYEAQTSGSGVDWAFDLQTPRGKALNIVAGVLSFLLAPFPWQIGGGSVRMAITLPEILAWWAIVFLGVWPGVLRSWRERSREVQVLLFFILAVSLLYGMSFYNVGLAYRQRTQILPYILMFGLAGFERRFHRARNTIGEPKLRIGRDVSPDGRAVRPRPLFGPAA